MKIVNTNIGNKVFHVLKRNDMKNIPENILFYDTESNITNNYVLHKNTKKEASLKVIKHSLRVGYYCFLRKRIIEEKGFFYTKEEFFKILINSFLGQRHNLYVVAHNQSFDFRMSLNFEMFKKDFVIACNIISNNHFILIFKHIETKRKIIFIDSFNYFKISVETMGEQIGIKKIEIKDFKNVDIELLKKRCVVDVEILMKYFLKMLDFINIKGGCFKYTIAGLSFNTYRHSFYKIPIHIHANMDAVLLERESYFGGRVECFRVGNVFPDENKYELDINSMYPFVMKKFEYPTKLIKFLNNPGVEIVKHYLDKKDCLIIADVLIRTNINNIPYYDIKKNTLIFPVGVFRTVLTNPELSYSNLNIIKCYRLSIYEKGYVFRDFVDYFYNKRIEYINNGDVVFNYFCKLFLNSLYGKFGQKNEIWDRKSEYDNYFEEDGYYELITNNDEILKLKIFKGEAFLKTGYYENYNSFVAIASFVTAYARSVLNNVLKMISPVDRIYCDTDAVFIREKYLEKFRNIIDDNKLGFLKIINHSKNLEIKGLKDYCFDGMVKIKGVKKKHIKLSDNTYKFSRFLGFNEAFHYYDIDNNYEIVETKTVSRNYKKGTIKNKIIKPLLLNEMDVKKR